MIALATFGLSGSLSPNAPIKVRARAPLFKASSSALSADGPLPSIDYQSSMSISVKAKAITLRGFEAMLETTSSILLFSS